MQSASEYHSCMLFTYKGTLLALIIANAEGRGYSTLKSCAGHGDVHIVLKWSTDYGNMWSDMIVVHIEANKYNNIYQLLVKYIHLCKQSIIYFGSLEF